MTAVSFASEGCLIPSAAYSPSYPLDWRLPRLDPADSVEIRFPSGTQLGDTVSRAVQVRRKFHKSRRGFRLEGIS